MAFADDKAAILAIMKGYDCVAAERADVVLQNYANVPQFLFENSNAFDCNQPYMYTILDAIDPGELTTLNIYYNGTSTPVNNPIFMAKYTAANVVYNSGTDVEEVAFMGSTIGKISVNTNTHIDAMTIGSASTVDVLETLDTSSIFYLRITSCNSYVATLGMLAEGSDVTNIKVDPGAYYGGEKCLEIIGTCADPVTAVTFSDVTARSITIAWTRPANSINVELSYRFKDANDWILITGLEPLEFGNFFSDNNGYVFRDLRYNTYYEFKVVNICSDGKPSVPDISSQGTLGAYP